MIDSLLVLASLFSFKIIKPVVVLVNKRMIMSQRYKKVSVAFFGAVALVMSGAQQVAQAAVIDFDVFSYTGSVTRYNSLSDAQANTGGSGPYNIPTATNGARSTLPNARDGSVYADTDANDFIFSTAWYYTPQDFLLNADGFGNPNNTNTGFVQLYDLGGASLSSLAMQWDPTFTQFSVSASGANAGASEYARLWPAPNNGGAASISGGEFLEYDFSLIASFSTPSPSGVQTGVTPDSVTGYFTGIFQNTGSDPALNGFYKFVLALQSGSSAADNNYAAKYTGNTDFETSASRSFVAPVPLPAAFPLFVGGLAGIGMIGWRRRRAAA